MRAKEISARDLRESQADILNQIAYRGVNFIVTRHGKEAAVMISVNEYKLFQEAIEAKEDAIDIAAAEESLAEYKAHGGTPLEQVKEELGINVQGDHLEQRQGRAQKTDRVPPACG